MVRLTGRTLRDLTLRTLGDELGGELLRRGAVHPIYGADRKKPGFPRHNEPWLDHEVNDFLALGLNAGDQSGLTVWDIDSHDLKPPLQPNVLTRRGCHLWTPYRRERHQQAGVPHLDVRSNGNVVFWTDTGDKEVLTTTLADPAVVHTFWEQLAGKPIGINGEECIGTSTPNSLGEGKGTSTYAFEGLLLPRAPYVDEVASRGWSLDLNFIANGAQGHVERSREGNRNQVLYRQCLGLIQCGIDPGFLLQAATSVGLPLDEAETVLRKANANFDPARLPSVLDRVDSWTEAVTPIAGPRLQPMIIEIGRRAVEQNTVAPMIVQQGFPDSVVQSTISRQLNKLDHLGVVHMKSMGYRPDGRRRSNCYHLCLKRTVRFRSDPCLCTHPRAGTHAWQQGSTWPAS